MLKKLFRHFPQMTDKILSELIKRLEKYKASRLQHPCDHFLRVNAQTCLPLHRLEQLQTILYRNNILDTIEIIYILFHTY